MVLSTQHQDEIIHSLI